MKNLVKRRNFQSTFQASLSPTIFNGVPSSSKYLKRLASFLENQTHSMCQEAALHQKHDSKKKTVTDRKLGGFVS